MSTTTAATGVTTTATSSQVERTDVGGSLGQDAFLKLLVAQMQNQDPTSPEDSGQMMSQLASFSQVSQLQQLTASNQALTLGQDFSSAVSLIGKSVTYTLAPTLLTGDAIASTRGSSGSAFAGQLADATRGVQFSGHAAERMAKRGVSLDASQLRRLAGGVAQAASKGSRSALVLVDRVAMIVAVPERTVVTAMATDQTGQGVFTNIDAAVVA
jgi:flagellar operon protein